jgi:hypothetical protein
MPPALLGGPKGHPQDARDKVHRTRPDKAAAQQSNHYHVGQYGLRGDTLGNAKGGSEA